MVMQFLFLCSEINSWNPWNREADNWPCWLDIPQLLLNPMIHYYVRKSPALHPVMNQMNSFHTLPLFSFKVHFNIILPNNFECPK